MNILGFNVNLSRAVPRAVTKSADETLPAGARAWLRGEDLDYGGAVLRNAYQQVVWVYRAINVLAEQVANIPFRFSLGARDGGEQLITSGPLLDFYARPHAQINRFQYWELRVIWLMLRGECFRVPIFDEGGALSPKAPSPHSTTLNSQRSALNSSRPRLNSVLMLDPARFQHIVADHRLIGWRYTGFGPDAPLASQVFLPEEVWFEKLPNPFDFWRGLSPLEVAAVCARADFAAGAFMQGFMENNADAGLIYRSEQQPGPEQRAQLIAALRDRKRRAGTADGPLLLWGKGEIIRPQLSSADLQFLENRKFSRGEICAAFGVPEEIVASTDHSKYDVMEGARLNFIENRIAPLCSRLEAEENLTTVPALLGSARDTGHRPPATAVGWFDLDSLPIMQQARRSRLTSARTGFDMGIPFNELNRVLDLGFKALPWGDRGYVAGKLQPVGQIENPVADAHEPAARKQEPGAGNQEPVGGGGRDGDAVARAARWFAQVTSLSSPPPEGSGVDSAAPQPALASSQLLRKLRRFFFEQRGRVLARLAEIRAGASTSTGENPAGQALTPEAGDRLEAGFDLEHENQKLLAVLQQLSLAPPASGTAHMPPPPAADRADVQRQVRALNLATLHALKAAFADGALLAESGDALAARVRAIFNDAADTRAPRIAAALKLTGVQPSASSAS